MSSSVGACGCFFVLSLSSLPSPKREEAWCFCWICFEESKKFTISKKTGGNRQGEKTRKGTRLERKFCVRSRRMSHYPKWRRRSFPLSPPPPLLLLQSHRHLVRITSVLVRSSFVLLFSEEEDIIIVIADDHRKRRQPTPPPLLCLLLFVFDGAIKRGEGVKTTVVVAVAPTAVCSVSYTHLTLPTILRV